MKYISCVSAALLTVVVLAAPTKYSILVVPPLAGDVNSTALGIDNQGRVLIESTAQGANARVPNTHFYVRNPDGSVISIAPHGDSTAYSAWGIGGGYVVGQDNNYLAFRYQLSTGTTEMLSVPAAGSDNYVVGINNNGDVVGTSGYKNHFMSTVWKAGSTQAIQVYPQSGESESNGYAINDLGILLGHDVSSSSTTTGDTYDSWLVSGYLPDATLANYFSVPRNLGVTSCGYALNNNGLIAGTAATDVDSVNAYTTLWQVNGTSVSAIQISGLHGVTGSGFFYPTSVNDYGVVVGQNGHPRDKVMSDWGTGTSSAYVYSGGVTSKLKALVSSVTPGYESYAPANAWGINNAGVIVGNLAAPGGLSLVAMIATPVPPSADLAVTLSDYKGDATKAPLTIEFRNPGTTTAVSTQTAYLNTSGHVVVNAPAPGTYDVTVKASHWLKKKITNLVFTNSDTTTASTSLVNGDVDGNNVINSVDHARVAAVVGTRASASAASAAADINGDGVVNAVDIAIINTHLRQAGDN